MKPKKLDLSSLGNRFILSHDISASSRVTYAHALGQFGRWCSEQTIEKPTREDILSYKLWVDEREWSSFTKAIYLVVVRQFFTWLDDQRLYENVARGIKSARRFVKNHKKDSLPIESIKRLFDVVGRSTLQEKRDFAIINLLVRTGLRLKEISQAMLGDLEVAEDASKLWVHGKGRSGKDEFVLLTKEALQPIQNYIDQMADKGHQSSPLFCSLSNRNYGKRLTTFSLSRMIKKYLRKACMNSKRISAHSLRHTFGVLAIQAGASLYEVQLAMRHMAPSTTEVYLGDIERLKRLEASPERKISILLNK